MSQAVSKAVKNAIKKGIVTGLSSLSIITLLLVCMVSTHKGNQLLWYIACQNITALEGELVKGSLLNTMTFRNVHWTQEDAQFSAGRIVLQLDVNELFHQRLNIGMLAIDNLGIQRPEGQQPTDKQNEKQAFSLPDSYTSIPVALEHIEVNGFTFQQGDTRQVIDKLMLAADISGSELTVDRLNLSIGDNRLTASGSVASTWNIQARLSAPQLAAIHPVLSGSMAGTLNITGQKNSPEIHYNVASDKLRVDRTVIHALSLTGHLKKVAGLSGYTELTVESIRQKTAQQDAPEQQLAGQTALTLKGKETTHQLTLTTESEEINGIVTIDGGFKDGVWNGHISHASVAGTTVTGTTGEWSLIKPAHLQVKGNTLTLKELGLESHPAQLHIHQLEASLDYTTASLSFSQLDSAQLTPFFPENVDWQTHFSGQAQVALNKTQPTATLHLTSTPGTIRAFDLSSEEVQLSLDARIKDNHLTGSVSLNAPTLGQTHLTLAVTDLAEKRQLEGQLDMTQFPVSVISPVLPDISDLSGILSANGRFSGTLKEPLIFGSLSLKNGSASLNQPLIRATDADITLTAQGYSATMDGQLNLNGGATTLDGNMVWQKGSDITGRLHLKGDGISFYYPGYGTAQLSPDLTLTLRQQPEITGVVIIPSANIAIKHLPENAIALSEDIVVVDPNTEERAPSHQKPFKMAVTIKLGDRIQLDALGLKARLDGKVALTKKPDSAIEGQGTIELVNGRLQKLGQDLFIKKGQLIVQGPLDNPYLVVDAYRNRENTQDEVTVGIKLTGPLLSPEWTIYSNPDMAQQEQLSYLFRGRSLDADNDSLSSTLIGLGIGQLQGVVSLAGEQLGFTDLTLDTKGSGDKIKVTIGGYIASGLKLQYGTGIYNSTGEFTIRYEIMPKLFIQAFSGLDQALDVFYRFTIGSN